MNATVNYNERVNKTVVVFSKDEKKLIKSSDYYLRDVFYDISDGILTMVGINVLFKYENDFFVENKNEVKKIRLTFNDFFIEEELEV